MGGVSLETVDELRSAAAAATTSISDCSLRSLLTDAVTSVVDTLRSVYCVCYYLQQGGYVFTLFVCLFVSRIVQKLLNLFSQNSVEKMTHGPRKKREILVVIGIILCYSYRVQLG